MNLSVVFVAPILAGTELRWQNPSMNSSVVPADRKAGRLLQQTDVSTRPKLVPEFKTPDFFGIFFDCCGIKQIVCSTVQLACSSCSSMVHLRGTGESSAKESFGLWGGGGNLSDTHTHTDVKLQALVYDILPSTTAVFSYDIESRKLSANEQFFLLVLKQ